MKKLAQVAVISGFLVFAGAVIALAACPAPKEISFPPESDMYSYMPITPVWSTKFQIARTFSGSNELAYEPLITGRLVVANDRRVAPELDMYAYDMFVPPFREATEVCSTAPVNQHIGRTWTKITPHIAWFNGPELSKGIPN